jgi:hypothetical protein
MPLELPNFHITTAPRKYGINKPAESTVKIGT